MTDLEKRLELHPEAIEEARSARLWYKERSPLAAEGFMNELTKGIARSSSARPREGLF